MRQHGGRLVEDEDAAAAVPVLQRRGDRDDGPLHGRRLRERPVDVQVDVEALEDPMGQLLLLAPADAAAGAAGEAAAQREVVHGVELEDEAEVLVDEVQARRDLVAQGERLAAELGRRAGVGRVVAGQRLDERGLARAVLTDERVDLAGADVERRVDERLRRRRRSSKGA